MSPGVRAHYARLLRVFPRDFRARYGSEILAFVEAQWEEARGAGRLWLLVRSSAALVFEGLGERVYDRFNVGRDEGRERMKELMKEIGIAFRGLRRRPGFAAVTLGTLALGVGAATTVFTVVDHVVLRPLPYPEPDRLISMWTTFDRNGDAPFGMSLAVQHDYAEDTQVIEAMGGFGMLESTWTGDGDAARIPVIWLRGEILKVAAIQAQMGRLPELADQETGAAAVAVVTDDFWRLSLAADPDVVGRVIQLDGRSVEIIGVLEPGASLPNALGSVWMPQARSRADITDRSGHWMDVLARLAPGETLESAQDELARIEADWQVRFAGQHSPGHPGHHIRIARAHDNYFGQYRATGRLLLGAVGLLMLLACANVAALLLARGETRIGEFAVRRALGAGRTTIARALLLESGLIALAGGAVGVLLAIFGTGAFLRLLPPSLPRLSDMSVDLRVIGFAVGLSLLSGLIFGVMPALRGGGVRPGTRGEAGMGRGLSGTLSGLVILQLGVAVVLVTGAGLLTKSVRGMLNADTGLVTENRLTAQLSISPGSYPETENVVAFWEELITRVEAIPGVASAGMIRNLPLGASLRTEGMVPPVPTADSDAMTIAAQVVSPGYFRTAGVPLVEGRLFDSSDREGVEPVVLINAEAARRYFPDGDAVGTIVQPQWVQRDYGTVRIVGVVDDVYHDGVRSELFPELYMVHTLLPGNMTDYLRSNTLVVDAPTDAAGVASQIRSIVSAMDPNVPIQNLSSWDDVAERAVVTERVIATLVLVFAGLALGLAALGTYGLVSFTTARRTREFGVRISLGAEPGRVARDVVGRTGRLAVVGVIIGAGLAAVVTPLLQSFLFGVAPRDPLMMLFGPVVMGLVTLGAAALPAIRASSVDPTVALRDEA